MTPVGVTTQELRSASLSVYNFTYHTSIMLKKKKIFPKWHFKWREYEYNSYIKREGFFELLFCVNVRFKAVHLVRGAWSEHTCSASLQVSQLTMNVKYPACSGNQKEKWMHAQEQINKEICWSFYIAAVLTTKARTSPKVHSNRTKALVQTCWGLL